jgi:hypothetical protein
VKIVIKLQLMRLPKRNLLKNPLALDAVLHPLINLVTKWALKLLTFWKEKIYTGNKRILFYIGSL